MTAKHSYKILGTGIVEVDSGKPGKTIGIVCNVHGNEPCGRRAAQRVLREHALKAGKLILIEGNPEAHLISRRFVDTDMNRVFTDETLASDSSHQDLARARYLTEVIPTLGLDLAIDFHSVSSETAHPFTVCFEQATNLAALCMAPVIHGWEGIVVGSLCEWMCNQGIPTVVVEAGMHEATEAVDQAEITLHSVLSHYGLIELTQPFDRSDLMEFDVLENVTIKDTSTFKLAKDFGSFEKVEAGQLFGIDKTGEYRIRDGEGYCLIMPSTQANIDSGITSSAYYLMKQR